MRAARRKTSRPQAAIVPAQSRVTVRTTVAALRRGRAALAHVDAELDALLAALRSGAAGLDPADASQRIRNATAAAAASLDAIFRRPG